MNQQRPRHDPRVTQTVAFQLLVAVNWLVRPFPEQVGKPYDLSLPEWRCMMALAAWPDLSGEDVARRMCMDRMAVSRSMARLRKAGRADALPDPANRKRLRWRLTDAGWVLFDTLMPKAIERDHEVFGTLSSDDRHRLAVALSGVVPQVLAAGDAGEDADDTEGNPRHES